MTTIVILAVLIGAIVFVLRMKPAAALEAAGAAGAAEGGKKPFILPERAKTVILFVASMLIGLTVSMYLNPPVVFVLLGAAAFVVYYRTDKGKQKVDKHLGGLKTVVAKSAATAQAAGQELAQNVANAADRSGEPIFNLPKAGAPSAQPDQLLDQLVSSVRVGRAARKALDGDLLPALASANDIEKKALATAVKSQRATFSEGRKIADASIREFARLAALDAVAVAAALEAVLVRENVASDAGLLALFRQMAASVGMASFDDVGYQKLVQDAWLRATENPGMTNSPV
ncbi:hypothetical protein [Phenylobacterium sp.]|uniref:hypothetical protein n=1 Tax=Phenylobacterium sp. TaxID=1871053 RepID=UPI0035AF56AB